MNNTPENDLDILELFNVQSELEEAIRKLYTTNPNPNAEQFEAVLFGSGYFLTLLKQQIKDTGLALSFGGGGAYQKKVQDVSELINSQNLKDQLEGGLPWSQALVDQMLSQASTAKPTQDVFISLRSSEEYAFFLANNPGYLSFGLVYQLVIKDVLNKITKGLVSKGAWADSFERDQSQFLNIENISANICGMAFYLYKQNDDQPVGYNQVGTAFQVLFKGQAGPILELAGEGVETFADKFSVNPRLVQSWIEDQTVDKINNTRDILRLSKKKEFINQRHIIIPIEGLEDFELRKLGSLDRLDLFCTGLHRDKEKIYLQDVITRKAKQIVINDNIRNLLRVLKETIQNTYDYEMTYQTTEFLRVGVEKDWAFIFLALKAYAEKKNFEFTFNSVTFYVIFEKIAKAVHSLELELQDQLEQQTWVSI